MATGDAAAAAGMDLVPQTGKVMNGATEINKTRDYIAERTNAVTPVNKGGTGATSAAAARTALGAAASAHTHVVANITDYTTVTQNALEVYTYNKPALDATFNLYVPRAGDVVKNGQLFLPDSFAASSGWTVAYINSDGRVCRGSSSLRYKKYVSEVDPLTLGNIFPKFHRFQMKADGLTPAENKWRYGPIAEDMAEDPDQEPFVVYREVDGESVPESVDFIGLLIAQVAQLQARVAQLEADHA